MRKFKTKNRFFPKVPLNVGSLKKIFETSDDTIEIFDIDANDDFGQAGRKIPHNVGS